MGRFSRTILLAMVLALVAIFSSTSSSSFAVDAQPASTQEHLQKKVSRLQAKASANRGIVELDTKAFDEVMAMPRNYSMVVLFTALGPEFKCAPCHLFDSEYRLVGAGWSKLKDKSKLFIGTLDFRVGQAIFQKFGMNSAPSVLYFPASETATINPLNRYELHKRGFKAEPFLEWLNDKAGTELQINRPFDFMALGVKVLMTVGVCLWAYVLYYKAGKIFGSKHFWTAVSMIIMVVMISGHMWNQIRNPPYMARGRDGPAFIAQGFQNQIGIETQLVAFIYTVLSGTVIALIGLVPRIENPGSQRIAVLAAMGLLVFMYSVLIQFFKVKNSGYPFALLFW
ncbi:oligosaccharyl transferase subunit ost3/OST6 [Mortierella polycephala]|uniref:Oligosaccharyl transferase subunit ost3/OST6 n=1 Tax=Mortierella polycephala TaxID=41804 RepID=A0A9P6PVD0_9FUNG|nr:oligosaccharyl transferase subunit ost3/OST6 [Mortierella polycephala]